MRDPQHLFDGRHLRATVYRPARTVSSLIVTFRQRIPNPGHFDDHVPARQFLKAGWTQLHIQSRFNDWYINGETQQLCNALEAFVGEFQHVAGIGFSMGGYGCLRFSAALGMAEAVVVSPQVSIHRDVVPFDTRYRASAVEFDYDLGSLARHARPDLRGVLLFDPFRSLDRRNVELIRAILPGFSLCRFGFGGHPATGVLRQTVKFGAVQQLVLKRNLVPAAFLALHRQNRAASPAWWQELELRAAKTGHLKCVLAARAQRSAERPTKP
jgi:hypothetical protein